MNLSFFRETRGLLRAFPCRLTHTALWPVSCPVVSHSPKEAWKSSVFSGHIIDMNKSSLLSVWVERNGEWILEALAVIASIYFTVSV